MPPILTIKVYRRKRFRDFFCTKCGLTFVLEREREDGEYYLPVRCPFCSGSIRTTSRERRKERRVKRIDVEKMLGEEI